MKMSLQEIKDYTEKFLKEAYGMELTVPVRINGRLKRTLGRFNYYKEPNKPESIEISKLYLQEGSIEDIKGTLKHEAIHYALFCQGKAFKDGQSDFENELRKHNSHSTGTVRLKRKRLRVIHECGCGNQWVQKKSLGNRYMCSSCKSTIKEVKREYVYN